MREIILSSYNANMGDYERFFINLLDALFIAPVGYDMRLQWLLAHRYLWDIYDDYIYAGEVGSSYIDSDKRQLSNDAV